MLRDQPALPEEVDEVVCSAEIADRLLEVGDGSAADAEDFEELVPEGLCLAPLARRLAIRLRERDGALADFIPAQWQCRE